MDILLIIDMQKGIFKTPRFDSAGVVSRINLVANHIRRKSGKVAFIQHEGSESDGLFPESEEWEILNELFVTPKDLFIRKTTCDSFYNTDLQKILCANHTKRLFITGCATDFCVDSTIRNAISKNYNVTVVEDCHTTANRPHLDAEKIIQHYNWIWKNLITQKGIELEVNLSSNILK